ncbi:LemA family protein [Candidatus Micrarchaeota archaeon]|jgi:LemA protein|nr:LemA family protein [Candidatus Micrarchaeota archaeon]
MLEVDLMLLIILGIIILVALIAVVMIYNGLIVTKNRVDNAWSQIDVQLRKRYDLVPNLVDTVKGYVKHEKEVLTEITKARASLMNADTIEKKSKADTQLTGALKTLFAVAENYPKLQANENFKLLQEQLEGIENKIAYSRQFYNDSVLDFNNKIQVFPNNLLAGMFNFTKKEYFEIGEEEARKNVKVKF